MRGPNLVQLAEGRMVVGPAFTARSINVQAWPLMIFGVIVTVAAFLSLLAAVVNLLSAIDGALLDRWAGKPTDRPVDGALLPATESLTTQLGPL